MKRPSVRSRVIESVVTSVLVLLGVGIYAFPAGAMLMLAFGIVHNARPSIPAFGFWESVVISGAVRLFVPTEERKKYGWDDEDDDGPDVTGRREK